MRRAPSECVTERFAPPRARRIALGVALLLLLGIPFFYGLGRWPLIEPDEGRNAEIARELLVSGNWVVPHFNGLPFLDKPVALFWMIAGAFRVFGVNEFAARLPSAVSAVALIALTAAIAHLLLDTRRAVLAAVVVATSPLVLIFGRLTIFDMPFSALVTLALWCLLRGRLVGPPAVWMPLAGLAMGVATLTKGPVGVAVPLLAWFAARGALPPPQRRAGWRTVLVAVLLFAGVVLPWLVVVAGREPAFLRYALFDETLLRFTSTARFHRGGPAYFHVVGLALGLGAWAAVLLATSPALARAARGASHDAVAIRFSARAAGAIVVFFSICASKRPGYIIPAMVPLGLLVAVGASAVPARAAAAVRTLAVGVLGAGAVLLTVSLGGTEGWTRVFSLEAAPAFTAPLLLAGGIFFLCWSAATLGTVRARTTLALVSAAALAPGLYVSLLTPLTAYAAQRSARDIARRVDPGVEVIALRTFRTSLPFYLGRPVVLASATGRELTSNYVTAQRDRFVDHAYLVRPKQLWPRLHDATPLYLLTSRGAATAVMQRSTAPLEVVAADRRSSLLTSRSTSPTLASCPPHAGVLQ
jgi:4-amino-4-deoxy-L-arabinose transferase-like glycosyltransferase